ncbi:MAG TPA: helix-turn-helix domain-containing protein [Chryseosolibacter sp.]|nr:helix-turn-helix domain-containing protein [Chryseosolibacter sp.]
MALSNLELTDAAKTAIHFINSTNSHVFLTGKAGTGKTTFLKNLSLHTHKQFAIVAPTGIAALNAGGVTIHSQFLFPFGMFVPDPTRSPATGNCYTSEMLAAKHPLNDARRQVLRAIDLLVVDEVSMLRCDLLDAIDYRLRSVRANFAEPFGGVQLLLIGDLFQLPPVVKGEEETILKRFYQSQWFFESRGLREHGFVYIELDKIYRQQDQGFIDVLNNLRNNTPTRSDIDLLNTYYKPSEEIDQLDDPVVTLTTHNYKADDLNQRALNSLETPPHTLHARINGDFPPGMFPVLEHLVLKEGAQIMFTKNDVDKMYFNGRLAKVVSIHGQEVKVELEGTKALYTLKQEVWENKRYVINAETKEITDEVLGTFEQYPVKLAWAITVHKSQGLTFSKAIIDVGNAFADGQVYVALSRLRSLDGLILRTRIDPGVITTDRQIVKFSNDNNDPDVLPLTLKSKQRVYILQMISIAFEFESILRHNAFIERTQAQPDSLTGGNGENTDFRSVFLNERPNTVKFRKQLYDLLDQENYEHLLERIKRGSEYYRELLWKQVAVVLEQIAQAIDSDSAKSHIRSLQELDLLLMKKIELVEKVSELTENILRGGEQYDFAELARRRASRRDSLMHGVRTATKNSQEIRAKRRRRPRKKKGPATHEITAKLLSEGKTLTQIAAARGLTEATVESHLARCVKEGKIEVSTAFKRNE